MMLARTLTTLSHFVASLSPSEMENRQAVFYAAGDAELDWKVITGLQKRNLNRRRFSYRSFPIIDSAAQGDSGESVPSAPLDIDYSYVAGDFVPINTLVSNARPPVYRKLRHCWTARLDTLVLLEKRN
ncbi:hypothetical protein GSI_04249 [Ganoderma sinense ZZ0214-1]|uniref:Uncharacterized protein n=1 Tax=Ganoderma sinense ZZ0214-1 TaxID=1077348 RepID=A0A2G8SIN7_9APHY|nr:hypothetical protein GSI_04249 [Ganoderma sinense ZZ0214-1]